MYYRELGRQDMITFKVLKGAVVGSMPRRSWWKPVSTNEMQFFSQIWTHFQGCFTTNGQLIGAAGLFLNPAECAHDAYAVGLDPETTAIIGHCMVLSSFRGRGISLKLVDALMLRAQMTTEKKDLLLPTSPDNLAMVRCAKKLGMKTVPYDPDHPPKTIYFKFPL